MKKKWKFLFLQFHLTVIISLIITSVGVFGFRSLNFSMVTPAVAQRITPSDLWQVVYQKLPDFPLENQYISKDNGKVAENNTLASRLIRYHIYIKGRPPIYRFDWKLTLADYLDANEIIYESLYPGNSTLKQSPLNGDRAAINKLTRKQRNDFVQVMVDIFNPNQESG